MREVLKKIFTVNLGVNRGESVLVFTDLINPEEHPSKDETRKREALRRIAMETAEAGKEFCSTAYLEFPSVMGHGKEPPEEVWRAAFGQRATEELKKKNLLVNIIAKKASAGELHEAELIIKELGSSPDCVVALSNYSTSHTRFRDYLTRCMRARYASMPLFEETMLAGAMTADWKKVEARTNRLIDRMSGGETVYVTSHNGTSISFSMKGRDVLPDTGVLTEPGSFGNLPAGEAFLAPVEGTAEGTLVLEWEPMGKLRDSVELIVREGRVAEVLGHGPFATDLRQRITDNPLVGNIAELGIGTNDKATRPNNILETEKILGTVHIAIGDNSSFGGKVSVPFHQDFIFFRPTLEVFRDGVKKELIIEGEPRF
ncbi:MAG: aminopeptidase [Deltaproteobacteria bacterium]|nr:aminopeptidase [Deltaproteobacteria bacterium]